MKKIALIVPILVFLGIAIYFGYPHYQAYKVKDHNYFTEEVKKDEYVYLKLDEPTNLLVVSDLLQSQDIITDADPLKTLIRYKQKESKDVPAGKFRLETKWTANALVNNLVLLKENANLTVVYNNVSSLEEIAKKVSSQMNFSKEELFTLLSSPETYQAYGFKSEEDFKTLFIPNTFEFYPDATPKDFLKKVAGYYKTFWNEDRKLKASELGYSQSEITTLASIVYEEQKVKFDEQPKIAGLYLNRLKKGWKLQADPTVKYAIGDPTIKRLLYKHLEVESPYNTYKHAGLPPGPISFPESQTIDAVLNYEDHDYMYMCAKPEYTGYHNFSKTLKQHNIYAKEYQKWLNSEGIQ